MFRLLLLATPILLAAACGEGSAPAAVNAGADASARADRYFEYPFYDPRDCPDDPLFNCTADLELCADGRGFLLVTDIINTGTWTEDDEGIQTSWEVGDVPPAIAFTVDGQDLVNDWNEWRWTRAVTEFSLCE